MCSLRKRKDGVLVSRLEVCGPQVSGVACALVLQWTVHPVDEGMLPRLGDMIDTAHSSRSASLLLSDDELFFRHLPQLGIDLRIRGMPHVTDGMGELLLQLVAGHRADAEQRQQSASETHRGSYSVNQRGGSGVLPEPPQTTTLRRLGRCAIRHGRSGVQPSNTERG